ncbi:MAG TPA: xylanase [Verrucomicrobiales bacterium]|nr:xylanase [Verrucomicrobiales bacterium]
MTMRTINLRNSGLLLLLGALLAFPSAAADHRIIPLWPEKPPGEIKELPQEMDMTKPTDNLIAGRRLMRIGNVSTPTLTVYPAPADRANRTSMIVCPGGGHHILAWDLEGTEVAEWLNSIGVTAFVLKYRVPTRDPENEPRWRAAVQDAQRAMSLVRSRAMEFNIDPNRIGLMGFSAGGETALLASLFEQRTYPTVDGADRVPLNPNFTGLIYSAGAVDRKTLKKVDHVKVSSNAPPMFIAHTYDDGVPVENAIVMFQELKNAGVPAELHIYSQGGHGYGLRETYLPVTTWHHRLADWMRLRGWLDK